MDDPKNLKKEVLKHVQGLKIRCANIIVSDGFMDIDRISLRVGYTKKEFELFLDRIDFEYDSGYGLQCIFGDIWHNDGSYSDRAEYDGREWWEHRTVPEIPDDIK